MRMRELSSSSERLTEEDVESHCQIVMFSWQILKEKKSYAYSECACAKSITLSQVKGQPV